MIIDYLKKLTFLSKEEIEAIEKKHKEHPELREAHKALAKEIITDLHGDAEYQKALNISECLFSDKIWTLKAQEIIDNIKDVPTFKLSFNTSIIDLLVDNNICSSKREAREMVNGNAISLNNKKINDCEHIVSESDAIEGKVLLIKKGKKNYYLGII